MCDISPETPSRQCFICKRTFPLTSEHFRWQSKKKSTFEYRCKGCASLLYRGKLMMLKRPVIGNPDETIQCRICRHLLPATTEFFELRKETKLGFRVRCHECTNLINRNLLVVIDPYKAPEGYRRCTKCLQIKPATKGYFYYRNEHQKLNSMCIECIRLRSYTYEENHREEAKARARKWIEDNREYYLCQHKEYNRNNRHKAQIWRLRNPRYDREWKRKNQVRVKAAKHRRLARKRELPDTFTADDYVFMMDYWGGCCAVTGEEGELQLDHWIPLSSPDCPGTVVTNMIPLLSTMNFRKSNKDPVEWLIHEFGEKRAAKIADRIIVYFELVKHGG